MKEYIERNELIENLNHFAPEYYNALINQLITKQPTADVVEAKRGKWIICCDGYYPYCSECGYEPPWASGRDMRTNYCPECGAIMDRD